MSDKPDGPVVWVVMGQQGEYSDHTQWTVCAFLSEEAAEAYAKAANARQKEVDAWVCPKCHDGRYHNDQRCHIATPRNELDDEQYGGYYGANFWAEWVPLRMPTTKAEAEATFNVLQAMSVAADELAR